MFDNLIQSSASRWSVPESWIRAVIEVESGGDPAARGAAGERGLMQILPSTAKTYGVSAADLDDPETNIETGARLLRELTDRFGEDFRRVYSAYNSGQADLWETSAEVGEHVRRALAALERWSGLTDETGAASGGMADLAILAAAIGLWLIWRHRG